MENSRKWETNRDLMAGLIEKPNSLERSHENSSLIGTAQNTPSQFKAQNKREEDSSMTIEKFGDKPVIPERFQKQKFRRSLSSDDS